MLLKKMKKQKKVQEHLQGSATVYSVAKADENLFSHSVERALYIWENCWGQQLSAPWKDNFSAGNLLEVAEREGKLWCHWKLYCYGC